tara:strand:- start:1876 stop:2130 length:255 start_codon:yes stop_codon:yes gene_type:complete
MYFGMIFQHHDVTRHESLIEPFRHADRLLCGELLGICYDAQHIFLVEVEIPDHAIYGSPVRHGIQFNELHLFVHDGLLCERAWR